ncbi:hypothetical protein PAHAL_2G416200 [Panicum hallii]|uniref:Uncharacterized protein n=1 Tax=Panicum hallii TaxID=206008 RepID=A0A2T8KSB9_9POAL|nr:hypothetical protein PAHAL_2G416200 [Panicum hallii]
MPADENISRYSSPRTMTVAQAAGVAASVVAAASAHAAACLSTACRRGTSRWALPSRAPVGTTGGFRWLRRRSSV